MVIQHESFEAFGTLDPLLKKKGLRIRYVNFERNPDSEPSLEKYEGLILMGGYMGVYESHIYTHLKTEMKLIEQALKKKIPILGICLGSQILAHVLGANVRKHTEREMGWYPIHLTEEGKKDAIFETFKSPEILFQSHGDTFDIPTTAHHLAYSELCQGQAFRYEENVYGLQFHLEIDEPTVDHWLEMPENQVIFKQSHGRFQVPQLKKETSQFLPRSLELSTEMFRKFLEISGAKEPPFRMKSRH